MSDRTPAARYAATAPDHHPGPPRFVPVGDTAQLAPRDPDPETPYRWELRDAPADSRVTVGAKPIVEVTPDVAGQYRFSCTTPTATHELVLRALPEPRTTATFSASLAELQAAGGLADQRDPDLAYYVCGPWNEWRVGEYTATRDGDQVSRSVDLPPGEHIFAIAPAGRLADAVSGTVTVPGPGRPRIRLAGAVEDEEVRITATVMGGDGAADGPPAVHFELDGRDELTREAVTVTETDLRLPVSALTGPVRIHAVAVGARGSLPASIQVTPPATGDPSADTVTLTHPHRAPAWVRDATVYEIFVRAFGGETVETTFEALERRLPYLDSLGVDCLWLTPIVASPTRHGYHVTDYFETAADLGPTAAFESFVAACHDRDIRVLFDLVINHTSRDHPAFQFRSAGVDDYGDHYLARRGADPSGIDWADGAPDYYFNWTRIPNLNHSTLAVRDWLLDVVDRWAPLVDGFRCDVAWGVPTDLWLEIRDRVRAGDAGFLMLDETVPRQARCTPGFGCHHDTVLFETLRDIGAGRAEADALLDTLEAATFAGFPPDATFLRYVENHDEPRYLAEHGEAALRAAAGATFTLPGTPMIYYGQERGVEERRGTMRWHDGDQPLTAFHRRLVSCRQATAVLREGAVTPVEVNVQAGDADRVTGYARDDGDRRVIVLLNFAAEPATVAVPEPVGTTDLVMGTAVGAEDTDGVAVDDVVVLEGEP